MESSSPREGDPQVGKASLRSQRPPVVVGEALVDQFDDGRCVVGGAPLNVAWNLGGFGLQPRFVSAIGEDAQGRQIVEAMERWGLSPAGMSIARDFSTGVVRVRLQDGQPSYEIVYPAAYDFLPGPDAFAGSGFLPLPEEGGPEESTPLLYLGSLAWRRPASHSVLADWIERFGSQRFVDINIRRPWFDESILELLVGGARYVKLNDDELSELVGVPSGTGGEIDEAVGRFRQRYGGAVFFITCGSRGAHVISEGERHFATAPRPDPLRDTVGAGDAFAARVIAGLHRQESLDRCIERGVRFAARVCSITGATTERRSLYREEVES